MFTEKRPNVVLNLRNTRGKGPDSPNGFAVIPVWGGLNF